MMKAAWKDGEMVASKDAMTADLSDITWVSVKDSQKVEEKEQGLDLESVAW